MPHSKSYMFYVDVYMYLMFIVFMSAGINLSYMAYQCYNSPTIFNTSNPCWHNSFLFKSVCDERQITENDITHVSKFNQTQPIRLWRSSPRPKSHFERLSNST